MITAPSTRSRRSPPWGGLLQIFYQRAGLRLPPLQKLEPDDIPQPYRRLLVHSSDLTPTLESFYQHRLGLQVLSRRRDGANYLREVVLQLPGSGERVGYGAIRILLEHLPVESARRVLMEQLPFGSILQADGIPHLSWPQAFFSAAPDLRLQDVLGLTGAGPLYGRRNMLLDGSRRLLAEVVELLAPVARPDFGATSPGVAPRIRNAAFWKHKR